MKKFEKPEMEVIVFEAEDIITESVSGDLTTQGPGVMDTTDNVDGVDGKGIETPISKPTETSMPEPTETSTPEPTETSTPEPTETSTPEPTETSTPEPTETSTQVPVDPGYTNGPGEMW